MKNSISLLLGLFLMAACQQKKATPIVVVKEIPEVKISIKTKPQNKVMANAATILARKQVPVLCYHNIKEFTDQSGEMTKTYTVKPANFAEQMNALYDAGYHSILPDQLYDYLAYGIALPSKPIMITFDDTRGEQYSIGATEMEKHHFKGVFFVMTVSINRPNYLTSEQITALSNTGNVVAAHTWDHHMVTKYTGDDWKLQLTKPKKRLEDITSKPVNYFAYPFGLWNKAAISEIKKSNYKMAFILSTSRDSVDPMYTVRRMIVSGNWKTDRVMKAIEATFNH